MEVRRMHNSSPKELYHHGIKGQNWGDRNGPPYPLDAKTSAGVKKSGKKNFIERHRDKKKMKKLRKIREKKQAEKRERERIIKSGNANEINRIKETLTDEEFTKALDRVNFNKNLRVYQTELNRAKLDEVSKKVETVAKTFGAVADAADKGLRVYNTLKNKGLLTTDKDKNKAQ